MKTIIKTLNILLFIFIALPNILVAQQGEVDRTFPPKGLPAKEITIADFKTIKESNGSSFMLINRKDYPKFRIMISFNKPYNDELSPKDKAIFNVLENMSTSYFKDLKEKEIYKELGNNGLSVSVFDTDLNANGIKSEFKLALNFFAKFLKGEYLTQEYFDKVKKDLIENFTEEVTVLRPTKEFSSLIIKDSLSFKKEINKPEIKLSKQDLLNVSLKDVKEKFTQYQNRSNINCILIGDFSANEIKDISNNYFSKAPKGKEYVRVEKEKEYTEYEPTERKIFVVDKPDANQSHIAFAWSVRDGYSYGENEPIFLVLDEIFGKSYGSNLNKNLRIDKGLTYGINSILSLNQLGGEYSTNVKVRTDVTALAVENIIFEMLRIRNEKVTQDRIQMAIDKILGEYAVSMSSISSPTILGFAMQKKSLKLEDDYLKKYPLAFKTITPQIIEDYARKYIKPYNCHIYITGNAAELKKQNLEQFGEVEYYNKDGKKM